MADTKVSALSLGTSAPEYVYGIQGGNSRRYHAKQVVNVRDFGPDDGTNIGNGVYDCTSIIQAAINAAFGTMPGSPNGQDNPELNKELYFPPGNYACNSPLYLVDTKGARIYGAGNGASQIFFQDNGSTGNTLGPDPDVTPMWVLDGCSDIEFSEISFGNSRNQTLPFCSYDTTAGTASGSTLTFTAAASVVTGRHQLVFNDSDPDSIPYGTRVLTNSGGSVGLDASVASAVGSGDRILFVTANVGFYLFESGDNGVSGNITWRHCNFANWGVGVLVAGTTGCANGILEHSQADTCALAVIRLENPEATNWAVFGGGTSQCALAQTYQPDLGTQGNHGASFSVVDGSISIMTNISTSCGPQSAAAEETSLRGGWATINAGGKPISIIGGRLENMLGFATVGSDTFLAGTVFGSGDTTFGIRCLDATFGGKITCSNVQFGNNATSPAIGRIADLGDSGILVMRECTMDNQTAQCDISGSADATVSMINSLYGSSIPTIANLFANFTGRVVDLQPECHGVAYASLPTANAKFQGLKGWITNCNHTTYMNDANGSGSTVVPVLCNGTAWKVA